MKKIIFATGNSGKIREVREIFSGSDVEVESLREAGIPDDAVEDGETFAENAVIKAKAAAGHTDLTVLADDSGLVIDALGGEPGVYSARYMGRDTSYNIKNAELIRRLENVPPEERTARFVCDIAAVMPGRDRDVRVFEGVIEGRIGYGEAGEGGFGYDPIFFISREDAVEAMKNTGMSEEEAGKNADDLASEALAKGATGSEMAGWISTAQLSPDAKNTISHRGRALLKARKGIL